MKTLSKAILILLISILSSASFAVLFTITSTFSIQGTAPYFTFNGKKLQQSEQLFSFSFKDTNNEVITKDGVESNSSETNPVELDLGIKKLNDITLVMPNNTAPNSAGDYEYELSEYIKDKNNFNDDDGDDKEGAKAEGKLTLTIKDRFGNKVKYEDYYDSCLAPYSFSFFLTDSKLSTKYGAPNTRDYPKASKTNYFINKNQDVKSCYVQPKSTTVLEFNGEKGIRSDWQADKTGFKIVSDADLNLNFPKTGFDNAQFTIALPVGANFDNLTFTKNGDANITLDLTKINLSEKQQSALVTIKGANKANPQTFTPTTFTINADGKNLYSFKLNKWFILDADSKGSIKDAMSYCFDLPDYRLINLHDITNGHLLDDAKGALLDAIPAWSKDGFARAIGDGTSTFVNKGSLTAEWGDITSYGYANGWMATSTQRSENLDSYISVNLTKGEQTTHTLNATVVAKACVSDGENLFAVKLPDGMVYHRGNNPSSKQTPIELQEGKTFADVNIKAGVNIVITGANGEVIARNQALTACDAPYKLNLSKDGVSVDYYFNPAGVKACFAIPASLSVPDDVSTEPEFVRGRGFKVIDVNTPKVNFPRTGFDNAFFNLKLANITAQEVITAMGGASVNAESGSGVKLSLEQGASDNLLKITLNGANNATKGGVFKPSIFRIKGPDSAIIYSFEISKWFVVWPDVKGDVYERGISYCASLSGDYRLPSLSEYTNGNRVDGHQWEDGTPGVNNDKGSFSRAIGNGKRKIKQAYDDGVGGILAEWGDLIGVVFNKKVGTKSDVYPNSDFENYSYWTADPYIPNMKTTQWRVFPTYSSSSISTILPINVDTPGVRVACVTTGKEYLSIIAPTTERRGVSVKLNIDEYYDLENNPSTAQNPIELQEGKTFDDVNIKDGVTIKITDASNKAVSRKDALAGCDVEFKAPYKLSLSKDGVSADYYFKLKVSAQACYAQPNLEKPDGTGIVADDFTEGKGFKLKDVNVPSKNFPRTGFDYAFFNLVLAGTTAQDIIKTMGASVNPEVGTGVKLKLEQGASANLLKITLNGPSHASNGGTFTPSTFKIKTTNNKVIYSFEVSKWFVATHIGHYRDNQTYCHNLNGNYSMPSVSEYTNGNSSLWAYGTPGVNNDDGLYNRAIGNGKRQTKQNGDDGVGGLFAEWGYTAESKYSSSGFGDLSYWGFESNSSSRLGDVSSKDGYIDSYASVSYMACVSSGSIVDYLQILAPTTFRNINEYFDKANNPSTAQSPIELQEGKTFDDVNIKDGVTIKITDASNKAVSRKDALAGCDVEFKAPYKLSLSKDGVSADYYFKSKVSAQACYAQPNLLEPSNTGKTDDFISNKGFKVIDVSQPSKNFPRTGFNNAFFDLELAGTTAQDVITAMGGKSVNAESGTGVKLSLEQGASANLLKITLNGPSHASNGGTFTPSTFKIKTTGDKVIYSFEVSKWFAAQPGEAGGYANAQTYCQNLNGNYRVPSVSEYTNGNSASDFIWQDGTLGVSNDNGGYNRAIGNGKRKEKQTGDDGVGGVIPEWGIHHEIKEGDFEYAGYWSEDKYKYVKDKQLVQWRISLVHRRFILPIYGDIKKTSVACVSTGKEYLPILAPTTAREIDEYIDIENNPSTAQNPIELQEGKTFDDVNIKDGVTIKITDASNKAVSRKDALAGCDVEFKAPYKLSLSKDGVSADYYFKPKVSAQACYARPDLTFHGGGSSDFVRNKGFKVINVNKPEVNFPSTGFNNAFFDLELAGTTAQDVITAMGGKSVNAESGAGVTLSLEQGASDNLLKIILVGPSDSNKAEFKPSTFNIKTEVGGNENEIYSFKVNKWFVASPEMANVAKAREYCGTLPNYRLPDLREMTNSKAADTVEGNSEFSIKRQIGKYLIAEWSGLVNYASKENNFSSDNEVRYWTNTYKTSTMAFYRVKGYNGFSDGRLSYSTLPQRPMCVSDGNPVPKVTHAQPNLDNGEGDFAGPANVWTPKVGFKTQSLTDYSLNFPTTGANNLYFDLIIENGVNGLTWDHVTVGNITAIISNVTANKVRVTLQGPVATSYNVGATAPKPTLPAKFELKGMRGDEIVTNYGFVISKWFVNRGNITGYFNTQSNWCKALGSGYKVAPFDYLTNNRTTKKDGSDDASIARRPGSTVGTAGDAHAGFRRAIGGGFISEWAILSNYNNSGFYNNTKPFNDYWADANITDSTVMTIFFNGDGFVRNKTSVVLTVMCVTE